METKKTTNSQRDLETEKQLEELGSLISDYTTKLQSSRQYTIGKDTEILIDGTRQKAQR